ncbi:Uncharacterised protein [Mycobacteroides abscessus subsp. abscessus]|nr:Uncharacterised protein [Mycobacteroides abscessus subsp. abscessus]
MTDHVVAVDVRRCVGKCAVGCEVKDDLERVGATTFGTARVVRAVGLRLRRRELVDGSHQFLADDGVEIGFDAESAVDLGGGHRVDATVFGGWQTAGVVGSDIADCPGVFKDVGWCCCRECLSGKRRCELPPLVAIDGGGAALLDMG